MVWAENDWDHLRTRMEGGKETVIGELGTFAVAMALMLWAKHLDPRNCSFT